MSDYEKARMKVVMDSFAYHNRITSEELIEIHVPSVTFPKKVDLQTALFRCVSEGLLRVDREDRYVKL